MKFPKGFVPIPIIEDNVIGVDLASEPDVSAVVQVTIENGIARVIDDGTRVMTIPKTRVSIAPMKAVPWTPIAGQAVGRALRHNLNQEAIDNSIINFYEQCDTQHKLNYNPMIIEYLAKIGDRDSYKGVRKNGYKRIVIEYNDDWEEARKSCESFDDDFLVWRGQ